jgi:hypothetical protein
VPDALRAIVAGWDSDSKTFHRVHIRRQSVRLSLRKRFLGIPGDSSASIGMRFAQRSGRRRRDCKLKIEGCRGMKSEPRKKYRHPHLNERATMHLAGPSAAKMRG